MKHFEGLKKFITTLISMMSINYVTMLIFKDNLDSTHKIELYSLIVVTLGTLAGVHSMLQSKIDIKKINPLNGNDK